MSETLTVEMAREQASALLEREQASAVSLRTCWACNSAHEHLRDAGLDTYVISCIGCGHYYYRGLDITAPEEPAPCGGESA